MFQWLLNPPVPAITEELKSDPASTRTDGRCRHCGGQLWDSDGIVICGSCSTIIESDKSLASENKWDSFRSNRSTHWNSKKPRCVGGFPHVYDWVDSDDIDHPVREINPEAFYK